MKFFSSTKENSGFIQSLHIGLVAAARACRRWYADIRNRDTVPAATRRIRAARPMSSAGFTLIELLVVIAIIGMLSSIVLASLNSARAKARDARRLADFKNMNTALELYYNEHNSYPASPNSYSSGMCGPTNTHQASFETVAQALVDEGFLRAVPKDPGSTCYALYDYGSGNSAGQLMVATLESIGATTEGPYGSCRPFTNNWCSNTQSSTYYCLCHPE